MKFLTTIIFIMSFGIIAFSFFKIFIEPNTTSYKYKMWQEELHRFCSSMKPTDLIYTVEELDIQIQNHPKTYRITIDAPRKFSTGYFTGGIVNCGADYAFNGSFPTDIFMATHCYGRTTNESNECLNRTITKIESYGIKKMI